MTTITQRRFCRLFLLAACLWISSPAAALENLLSNGDFDANIAGWVNSGGRPAAWNALDADGIASSGSVQLTDLSIGNGGGSEFLIQCVPVNASAPYAFGADVRKDATSPEFTYIGLFAIAYDGDDCSGGSDTLALASSDDTAAGGEWEYIATTVTTNPDSQSMLIALAMFKETGVAEQAVAYIDKVFLVEGGLPQPFDINPSFSSVWFNPAEPGHGVMISLISAGQAWMCWFNFDVDANRAWVCGLGAISGDTLVFNQAFLVEGGRFPPEHDEELVWERPWGNIFITFSACNSGEMEWLTDQQIFGAGPGSMPLERLVGLWGNACEDVGNE